MTDENKTSAAPKTLNRAERRRLKVTYERILRREHRAKLRRERTDYLKTLNGYLGLPTR